MRVSTPALYSMKKLAFVFLIGVITGAISWGSAGLVSDRFEPFDSEVGFYSSQFILSTVAFYIGYKRGVIALFAYFVAAHVGMNLFAFIFGGSEQRAWALLAMVTTILLLVFPLIFGLAGKTVDVIQKKYDKAI